MCSACSPTSPQVVTSTKLEVAVPADVLTTPCVKTPVRFATAGDIVSAYRVRDADFDVCAAKVQGTHDYLQRADPNAPMVIPAPIPKPTLFKRSKPKKVSS